MASACTVYVNDLTSMLFIRHLVIRIRAQTLRSSVLKDTKELGCSQYSFLGKKTPDVELDRVGCLCLVCLIAVFEMYVRVYVIPDTT